MTHPVVCGGEEAPILAPEGPCWPGPEPTGGSPMPPESTSGRLPTGRRWRAAPGSPHDAGFDPRQHRDSQSREAIDSASVARPTVGQLDGLVAASRFHQSYRADDTPGGKRRFGQRAVGTEVRSCLGWARDDRRCGQQSCCSE